MRLIDADALINRITNPYEQAEVAKWVNKMPTINGWISVKDRMPPQQDIVIVAINDDSGDTPYRYTYFGWYMQEAACWIVDDEIRRGEVYAWMPLPAPPKEDNRSTFLKRREQWPLNDGTGA